jgi:hypothetical protein
MDYDVIYSSFVIPLHVPTIVDFECVILDPLD